jgi:hypothetical protein
LLHLEAVEDLQKATSEIDETKDRGATRLAGRGSITRMLVYE